jgi:hypothetical protein
MVTVTISETVSVTISEMVTVTISAPRYRTSGGAISAAVLADPGS